MERRARSDFALALPPPNLFKRLKAGGAHDLRALISGEIGE